MDEKYDAPWDLTIDFAKEVGHDIREVAKMERYQREDKLGPAQPHIYPELGLAGGYYTINVMETAGVLGADKSQQTHRDVFVGELPNRYSCVDDLEDEFEGLKEWKR